MALERYEAEHDFSGPGPHDRRAPAHSLRPTYNAPTWIVYALTASNPSKGIIGTKFNQVKVVSEPQRIDVFLITRSCAKLTVISCWVVYEATFASPVPILPLSEI